MSRPYLTIIIPAYNEAQRIPHSLTKIATFLRAQSYSTEILVVENRSTDHTSAVVRAFVQTVSATDPFTLELLHSVPGKGAAVKTGMLVGKGDYLFICDADLSMPIEEIAKFLPPEQEPGGYDVAIASREIAGAVRYNEPFYRHLMGRVFNFVVRKLIIPGIEDTQCGFKMFYPGGGGAGFSLSDDRWLGVRSGGLIHQPHPGSASDRSADQLALHGREPNQSPGGYDQDGAGSLANPAQRPAGSLSVNVPVPGVSWHCPVL